MKKRYSEKRENSGKTQFSTATNRQQTAAKVKK
jgi:hypothetical protein